MEYRYKTILHFKHRNLCATLVLLLSITGCSIIPEPVAPASPSAKKRSEYDYGLTITLPPVNDPMNPSIPGGGNGDGGGPAKKIDDPAPVDESPGNGGGNSNGEVGSDYDSNALSFTPGPVAPDPENYNCAELRDFHGGPQYTLDDFVNANSGLSRGRIINQRMDRATIVPIQLNGGGTITITLEGGPEVRYIRDPLNPNIVIDLRHLLVVGRMGRVAGESIEIYQAVTLQESALNHQDYYSNELGYSFYQAYGNLINANPNGFVDYLNTFLRSMFGRVPRTDPAVVNRRCP